MSEKTGIRARWGGELETFEYAREPSPILLSFTRATKLNIITVQLIVYTTIILESDCVGCGVSDEEYR